MTGIFAAAAIICGLGWLKEAIGLRANSVRRCNSGGPHLQLYRHVISGTPERRGRPGRNPRIIQLNRRKNL